MSKPQEDDRASPAENLRDLAINERSSFHLAKPSPERECQASTWVRRVNEQRNEELLGLLRSLKTKNNNLQISMKARQKHSAEFT